MEALLRQAALLRRGLHSIRGCLDARHLLRGVELPDAPQQSSGRSSDTTTSVMQHWPCNAAS
jgi:hypothetical protein